MNSENSEIPTLKPGGPTVFWQFCEAINDRQIGIRQTTLNEFLVGMNILYRRLQRAIERFLNTLEEYEERRIEQGWNDTASAGLTNPLDDYLEVIYIAAELFDFYEKGAIKVAKSYKKRENDFVSLIKKLKREFSALCNKCKHNYSYLQLVEAVYENGTFATGFILYKMAGDRSAVERDIHPNREAFSFNWSLRRLIGNLMLADHEAANLVNSVDRNSGDRLNARFFTNPLLPQIERTIQRPRFAMPNETLYPEPVIELPYIEAVTRPPPDVGQGLGKLWFYADILCDATTLELPHSEVDQDVLQEYRGSGPMPRIGLQMQMHIWVAINDSPS